MINVILEQVVDFEKAILVWRFHDAPGEFQEASTNGGDEDWIAFVPGEVPDQPSWMDEHTSFGCCSVDEIKVEGGHIYIGSHA